MEAFVNDGFFRGEPKIHAMQPTSLKNSTGFP
jgi:hypothetical protein